MKADRWQQIDRLLDEALALSPDEREAFLARVSDSDQELRREVASLLRAHDRAEGKFLDAPALELAARGLAAGGEQSLIGKWLGPYQILSVLGVGGMGEVYLARDERLRRQLALKILPPQFVEDSARVERFTREARAVSALNHPNIVTLYDIGKASSEFGRAHFIAMEHVDGQTLREKILAERHRQSDAREVIEITLQISAALAAAHEAGIIHRDIKPENVMLRRDNYVKVLDFGLAKLTERRHSFVTVAGVTDVSEGDLGKTNPGAVLGTARYMSPEQALGEEVDARSDLFSLGVLLYELLAGAPPFKGNSIAATLDAIVHHQPTPLSQLRTDLAVELEAVINRALEKDRELRYQTAADLRADLKRLVRELDSRSHGLSAADSRAAPPVQSTAWWKRKTKLAALSALLALLVAATAVGWWLWSGRTKTASTWEDPEQMQVTDFPGEELFPSLSPSGSEIVYARRSHDGNFDIWLQRVGGSNPRNLTADCTSDDMQAAFSPDGKRIAYRSECDGGGIWMMGASGESARRLTNGASYHPAWSPDSKEIIFTDERITDPRSRNLAPRKLQAVNIESLQTRIIAEYDIAQPSWSPNGHRIAYWGQRENAQRDIWTISAAGGAPLAVTNDVATDWNPVWSPDGNYLYFSSDRSGAMNLWRVPIDERSGQTLGKPELVPTPSAFSQHISFSKDGRKMAFVDLRERFRLASASFDPAREMVTTKTDDVLHETSWRIHYPDVSPDGSILVYNATVGNREDLFLLKIDRSSLPQKLTDDDDKDRYPRWSPDGNRIAFYSNRNGRRWQIWLINRDGSGRQQVTVDADGDPVFPQWLPGGEQLAYVVYKEKPLSTSLFMIDLKGQLPARGEQLPYDSRIRFWLRDCSPDGNRLIGGWRENAESSGSIIKTYSLATKQFETVSDLIGDRLAWLDGHRIAALVDGKIFVVDSRTGKARGVLSRPPYQITWFSLPRDGRTIYFAQNISEANIWVLSQNPAVNKLQGN
ncbi:MAG: protein kinase [Acidobacteriota bacterium]|nr:protein kinase [Acidobacteriota bacterium]